MKKFLLGFVCALVFVWLKKRYSVKVTEVHDDEKRDEAPVTEEKDFTEVPGTGEPNPKTIDEALADLGLDKGQLSSETTGNFVGYRNRVRV